MKAEVGKRKAETADAGHKLVRCFRFPLSYFRFLPFAVFAATLLAYLPAMKGGLIWDDDAHVTRPDLRSLHGLWRIWFELGATQQYYPVLHSAFWLEHLLWGDATVGYHLVNVLLHATSACLFGVILSRLLTTDETLARSATGSSVAERASVSSVAWLAAFIFALHPVCVESVAWISEQKNTLSTVFYLLAALAYLRFDERREKKAYALALVLFVLAVLSKSVTATLPGALLVVIWWKRGRLSWRRDVTPQVTFFAIGAAAGLLTAWVERKYIGAQGAAFDLSLLERCLLAGRVIWFYLGKLAWPANLIFIYPHWHVSAAAWRQYLFPLAAVALVAALWAIRRRSRGPLAALLFFIGTLFPALGFFNVYPFVFSYVADHFQYLASMGVITAAAAAITKYEVRSMKYEAAGVGRGISRFVLRTSYFVLLPAVLGTLTWRQCRMYRDAETLYRTTIARNPDCWMAHNNLGIALFADGRTADAVGQYEDAVRLKPDYADAYFNMGIAVLAAGKPQEAIGLYEKAILINPDFPKAQNALGIVLAQTGRSDEALAHYREAIRLNPGMPEAYNSMGVADLASGKAAEAADWFEKALRLDPNYAEAHDNLGIALAQEGRLNEAILQYAKAVSLKPDYAEAQANWGIALADAGRFSDAIPHYQEAVSLKPDDAEAHSNLGTALASTDRLEEAVIQYREAVRLKPGYAEAHRNLGTALRQLGRAGEAQVQFDEAARLGGGR